MKPTLGALFRDSACHALPSASGDTLMTRLIVLALGLCIGFTPVFAMADEPPDEADAVALVTLADVTKGSLPVTVTAYGQVQPGDTAQQSIGAPLSVRVSNVMVKAGEQVPAGTPLLTVVPSPESAAAYKQAKLALRLANEIVERDRATAKLHLLTESELARAEKDLEAAKSDLAVLEEEGAVGPNTFKAPFDAIVMKVDNGPGSVVAQGAPLIELARPEGLVLEVGVVAAQAAAIVRGNAVTIASLSGGASLPGEVLVREVVIDPTTGLVPVQISFPLGKLLAGEMARAVITTGDAEGYVVPHEAILVADDGSNFLWQAVEMEAKKVKIRVVVAGGDKDVVTGKINAKAQIVLSGNKQLDDGTKMRVAENDADAKGADSNAKDQK
jgi:membrane fusion protein (multidrug efflux system)